MSLYTAEERKDRIKRLRERGVSIADIARANEIHPQALRNTLSKSPARSKYYNKIDPWIAEKLRESTGPEMESARARTPVSEYRTQMSVSEVEGLITRKLRYVLDTWEDPATPLYRKVQELKEFVIGYVQESQLLANTLKKD